MCYSLIILQEKGHRTPTKNIPFELSIDFNRHEQQRVTVKQNTLASELNGSKTK